MRMTNPSSGTLDRVCRRRRRDGASAQCASSRTMQRGGRWRDSDRQRGEGSQRGVHAGRSRAVAAVTDRVADENGRCPRSPSERSARNPGDGGPEEPRNPRQARRLRTSAPRDGRTTIPRSTAESAPSPATRSSRSRRALRSRRHCPVPHAPRPAPIRSAPAPRPARAAVRRPRPPSPGEPSANLRASDRSRSAVQRCGNTRAIRGVSQPDGAISAAASRSLARARDQRKERHAYESTKHHHRGGEASPLRPPPGRRTRRRRGGRDPGAGGPGRTGATRGPDEIQPPAGKPFLVGHGVGVQIYACDGATWNFVAPRADLFADNGQLIIDHFGGPSWRFRDGSTVVGTVVNKATVDETAIQWLLLSASPRPELPTPGGSSARRSSSASTPQAVSPARNGVHRRDCRHAGGGPLHRRLLLLEVDGPAFEERRGPSAQGRPAPSPTSLARNAGSNPAGGIIIIVMNHLAVG